MTLIGGRMRLDSWLSTVARMAFYGRKKVRANERSLASTTPISLQRTIREPPHLEEFKQHVVEVGGDIDHVNWLFGVGCCWGSQDQRQEIVKRSPSSIHSPSI